MRVNEHPEDKMQRIRGRVWYWDILRLRVRRYMYIAYMYLHIGILWVRVRRSLGGGELFKATDSLVDITLAERERGLEASAGLKR